MADPAGIPILDQDFWSQSWCPSLQQVKNWGGRAVKEVLVPYAALLAQKLSMREPSPKFHGLINNHDILRDLTKETPEIRLSHPLNHNFAKCWKSESLIATFNNPGEISIQCRNPDLYNFTMPRNTMVFGSDKVHSEIMSYCKTPPQLEGSVDEFKKHMFCISCMAMIEEKIQQSRLNDVTKYLLGGSCAAVFSILAGEPASTGVKIYITCKIIATLYQDILPSSWRFI